MGASLAPKNILARRCVQPLARRLPESTAQRPATTTIACRWRRSRRILSYPRTDFRLSSRLTRTTPLYLIYKTMSTEKHHFQAEIQQLLDIVIHSLYTDREVFVRELVSNAADACEKLRFLQTPARWFQPDIKETIAVKTDAAAGTVTISDTGLGMTRNDLVENLGTIAHWDQGLPQATRGKPKARCPAHRPVRRGLLFRLHGGRQGHRPEPLISA